MRALWFTLLLVTGCDDKAKADYDRCVERDHNYDVAGAVSACQAAVATDSKSQSGQAAAKKLLELQSVSDKLKAEQAEKIERDKKIKKDDPPLVVMHSAEPVSSVVSPGDNTPYVQAQALITSGDNKGAQKLLQERLTSGTASPDELKLLQKVCRQLKDKTCLAAIAKARQQ